MRTTPDGKYLYAANEVMDYDGGETVFSKDGKLANDGSITSYSIDQATGKLTKINQVSSGGGAACHISVNRAGTQLVCSNYMGGNVSLFNIENDGSLSPNSQVKFANKGGPNKARQEASHPHSANFVNPSWSRDQYVHIPDLGNDQTHMLSFDGDNKLVNTIAPIEAASGSGPRHLTYDSK